MANEKEVKQLQTLIDSMKSASDALVKVYPTGSLTLKYMSDDLKIIVADLQGRPGALEAQRDGFCLAREQAKLFGRETTIDAANSAHQERMAKIGRS